ncbi:MAG TPA: hypothetical protein PKD64_08815 [Pirellulaceae bacterium]|nr:hypothetical protein [Pirellulaceae bacterium]HMO92288.1 hypothetical protein [Pirellulaceae bacterium]HMP71005.1 hypothetical protein [Pirellulaceae bacterium]
MSRRSWLDDGNDKSLIDEYVSQMETFIDTMADGRVDQKELESQEARLVKVMKSVEGKLDDKLHAEVTELLCELTAYNVMQLLFNLEANRPHAKFVG